MVFIRVSAYKLYDEDKQDGEKRIKAFVKQEDSAARIVALRQQLHAETSDNIRTHVELDEVSRQLADKSAEVTYYIYFIVLLSFFEKKEHAFMC